MAKSSGLKGLRSATSSVQVVVVCCLAYNTPQARGRYHPKGRDSGYVFTFGALRVCVAGDTEDIPEARGLKGIDVTFVLMNLPFSTPPKQVADPARAMGPKVP